MGQGFPIYQFWNLPAFASAIVKGGGRQKQMSQYPKNYISLSSNVDDIG